MRLKVTENVFPEFSVGKITDSYGNSLPVATVPFTDSEKSKLPKKIRVLLEATHTGINKNLVEYTHDGLASSVDSWTKDFCKPVLLNHNTHSDPLGRVVKAEYKQSVINPEKYCIQLELEITNAAAIERFLDGRYQTFSIGGYTDSAKCSICGKDQMEDGWCGHRRGAKYGDKTCYWTLGTMEYAEISVVNCPADQHAQAISLTDEDGNEIEREGKKGTESTDQNGNEPFQDDSTILGGIDGILGLSDSGSGQEADDTHKDEGSTDTEEGQTDSVPEPNEGAEDTNDSGNPVDQKDELENRIKDLESQLTNKDEELEATKLKLQEANTLNEELNDKIKAADNEKQALVNQNVAFAKYAHKILCENCADMHIALGKRSIEERDALVEELSTQTSTKLSASMKDLADSLKKRVIPVVEHPGAGQIDNNGHVSESTTKDETHEQTIEDYCNMIVDFIINRRA